MVKGLGLPNILVHKTSQNSSWVPQFGDEKRFFQHQTKSQTNPTSSPKIDMGTDASCYSI
jgi:hypothetical protein